MTTLQRTADVAGQTYTLTCKTSAGALVTPTATPGASMFTDAGRVSGEVVLVVTPTAQPQVFTVTLPATPTGQRWLKHVIPTTSGAHVDADDDVQFAAIAAEVDTAVVSLAETREYLRKANADPVSDALIVSLIGAATEQMEREVTGAILPRSEIERFDGGGTSIYLSNHVVSITSVTEYQNGSARILAEHAATAPAPAHGWTRRGARLRRTAAGAAYPFAAGIDSVHVAYVAGFAAVPEPVKHAVREQVRLWWVEGRNAAHPGLGGGEDGAAAVRSLTQAGLHPRVRNMLYAYRPNQGFA